MRARHGLMLSLEALHELVAALQGALILDGPAFRAKLAEPIRKPSCIGCYEGDPHALRNQLRQLFTHPRSGLPEEKRPDGSLRAALVPHIDYGRGGAQLHLGLQGSLRAHRRLACSSSSAPRTTARIASRLTRKHFQTPLGRRADRPGYIDRLVEHYGDGLFDDEAGPSAGALDRAGSGVSAIPVRRPAADPHRAAAGRLVPRLRPLARRVPVATRTTLAG